MKQLVVVLTCSMMVIQGLMAQSKLPATDKSPMDMSYYPVNYPVLKIQNKASEPLVLRVIYSRPQKNGRSVYGELVEYGKVWRLGANEATELELYKDVKIGANKLKKGRYTMYAIPNPDKWTIILNKETDIWGAFQYDEKKDVLRTEITVEKRQEPVEMFSMAFEKTNGGVNLVIMWDDVKAILPITF
ncbi:MAG: DUF2911 domain-containing protein [Chitinophagaceae bacterium]|nr:DUF2911 domain-containing protein [Chitinophagaceae bacterium]